MAQEYKAYKEMHMSDDEDESQYVDQNRVINTLEMRALLISLPDAPTHPPSSVASVSSRPARLSAEEECRIALSDKIQSDDDDDDNDYEEEEQKSKKKRKRGADKKKTSVKEVNLILDTLQIMQRQGKTQSEMKGFLSSVDWTDKKIFECKTALASLIQISNKSASATETVMIKYLTGLQNDHPDAVLGNQCRDMTYPSLQKATTQIEDDIHYAEMDILRLKNELKIHKFFLEVHHEQTHDRCALMELFFSRLTQIESRRFLEASSKTSARKQIGRRGGPGGGSGGSSRSNEV
jgi:hypothetical protein